MPPPRNAPKGGKQAQGRDALRYSVSSMAADNVRAQARPSLPGVLFALAGLLLFFWALRQTGLTLISEGIGRLGPGFLVILLLAGARFWVRAVAWSLATEPPEKLRTSEAFRALVAGDTLGNLTPLGLVLSETTKAAYVRPGLSLMAAVAGIAIENLIYTLTVALVIASGTIALLLEFNPTGTLRTIAVVALSLVATGFVAVTVLLTSRIRAATRIASWLRSRGWLPDRLGREVATLATLEDQVCGFAARYPRRLYAIFGLDLAFHAVGVLEVWLTLAWLLPAATPTLVNTFILESVNRTIMVVFKFVPLRLGVDEVGTELLTRLLGLPLGIGVIMAVIRKARMIVWSAAGVAFLLRRGLRAHPPKPHSP